MSKPYEDRDKKWESNFIEQIGSKDVKRMDNPYLEDGEREDQNSEESSSDDDQPPLAGRISGTMEELERIQQSETTTVQEIKECLIDCMDCYKTVTETMLICLNTGGKYAEIEQLNLLIDCAKICNTNADFILRNSNYYPQTCGITADICDECADICERFDDNFMKECTRVCRRCAESCREMAR
jgi:hypothetical protein